MATRAEFEDKLYLKMKQEETIKLLQKVANALYFVYDEGNRCIFDRGSYETLAIEIDELVEKLQRKGS